MTKIENLVDELIKLVGERTLAIQSISSEDPIEGLSDTIAITFLNKTEGRIEELKKKIINKGIKCKTNQH